MSDQNKTKSAFCYDFFYVSAQVKIIYSMCLLTQNAIKTTEYRSILISKTTCIRFNGKYRILLIERNVWRKIQPKIVNRNGNESSISF